MIDQRSLRCATLGALGVVYGDIGRSRLYALRRRRLPRVGSATRPPFSVSCGKRCATAPCHLVRGRPRSWLAGIKSQAFAYLLRRSAQAAEFFRMPTKRVVVLATEIDV
jgi:K+ transporter